MPGEFRTGDEMPDTVAEGWKVYAGEPGLREELQGLASPSLAEVEAVINAHEAEFDVLEAVSEIDFRPGESLDDVLRRHRRETRGGA